MTIRLLGTKLTGRWHAHADSTTRRSFAAPWSSMPSTDFAASLDTHYVAAHQGEPGNELADQLAGEAAAGHPLSRPSALA